MKKIFFYVIFVFSLCISFSLSGICCFADAGGYIDVQVDAPAGFTHSIMVNLVDEGGINYLVTAESVNEWKANYPLPAGDYKVDYVTFEVKDADYQIQHPDTLTILNDAGTALPIKISRIEELKDKSAGGSEIDAGDKEPTPAIEKISCGQMLLNLLKSILINNYITLTAIIVLLVIYIRKRRHNKDGEEY